MYNLKIIIIANVDSGNAVFLLTSLSSCNLQATSKTDECSRMRSELCSVTFLTSFPYSFSVSDCIFLLISDYVWKQATLSELSLLLKRAGSFFHKLERLERTEKEPWPGSPRAQLAARPGIFSCLTLTKSLHSSFTHNSEMTE